MRRISLMRFNALAGYCRTPLAGALAHELLWFEDPEGKVLGVLFQDQTDGDYGGTVLGRDRKGRFRSIGLCGFHPTVLRAKTALVARMAELAAQPGEAHHQGDEQGKTVDFFIPQVPRERLSTGFLRIAEEEGFSPARGIIEPMMRWYEDPDGNFIEQFQTTGFSARIWELYLFAAFVEMGFQCDRTHAAPDFACVGFQGDFFVEAVTTGPSRDPSGAVVPPPPIDTAEAIHAYTREYMPIRFSSVLTTKLAKRYWELPHVAGKPFVLAVHDFHAPMSMLYSRAALPIYLYGYDEDWARDEAGQLHVLPRRVETHQWGPKPPIPSGFFRLPDSQNVSAVLFSNSGTISKFNRMGLLAGIGSPRVHLIREGAALDHDPNATEPRPFVLRVSAPEYSETWVEGLEVYHNPGAKHPLAPEMLPGAAHHRLRDDARIESISPDWHPLRSRTYVFVAEEGDASEQGAPTATQIAEARPHEPEPE